MANTLLVIANNRPAAYAVSVQLYEAFKRAYLESHPEDTVTELDLYREELPYMGADLIAGSFKSGRGLPLSPAEQAAVGIADRYLEQFLAADKIAVAFPLWNMGVPAVLHTYIDYLNRAGKTFAYTPQGPIGLAGNKRVVLLNARGGDYSREPAADSEMAVNFVLKNLRLFGVTDVTTVIVEGHQQDSSRKERLIAEGIERAKQAAIGF